MSQTNTTFNFGKLLKVLIAVLTALAGSLGVVSCTKKKAPSTPPEGELTVIAEKAIPTYHEDVPHFHDF